MKKELLPYSINKLLEYAFEVTLDEDSVFYTDDIVEKYEKWKKMSKWNRIKYVTMFSIGKYWIQKESETDFYSINYLYRHRDMYYNFLTGVFEHSYKKQNKTKDIFKCFAIVKKLRTKK